MPERDSYTPGTPCWVDLATNDVESAKAFYAKLLNWTWTANDMGDGNYYYMFNIRGRNTAGMMAISPEMAGMPPAWSTYLWSDDADASVAAATANGATVMVPPTDVHEHGRMAFVIDPTGAPIGIWQPNQHRGSQLFGDPGAMCWHELQTPDPARAVEFYSKTFGCTAQTAPMEGLGDYTILLQGDEGFAGVMAPPMEGTPPHWEVVFAVENADLAAQLINEGGGTVLAGPMDIEPGRYVVFADPQGAVAGVIQLAPAQ